MITHVRVQERKELYNAIIKNLYKAKPSTFIMCIILSVGILFQVTFLIIRVENQIILHGVVLCVHGSAIMKKIFFCNLP